MIDDDLHELLRGAVAELDRDERDRQRRQPPRSIEPSRPPFFPTPQAHAADPAMCGPSMTPGGSPLHSVQAREAREARRFLEGLDPNSQEALWFEALAEGYPNRLAAALVYLREVKG